MALEYTEVLSRLDGVKGSGTQCTAKCPAHDDRNNSLSVSCGGNGQVLLYCHAGCETEDIVREAGLEMKDLFPDNGSRSQNERENKNPIPRTKSPKSTKSPKPRTAIATYDYTDAKGNLLFQKIRYEPKGFSQRRPDGKGGWEYNLDGVAPVPYHLPEVIAATREGKRIFIVEGEKDAETMRLQKETATCNPHGAGVGKWQASYNDYFNGTNVIIIPDNDEVGKRFSLEIAENLSTVAQSVKVLDLARMAKHLPEHGDITDIFQAVGDNEEVMDTLEALISETMEYEPQPAGVNDYDWDTPLPFDEMVMPLFPTESLPSPVEAFVEALAESTQTPMEMSAVLSLGILATAFQSRYEVEITSDWKEPLCLYPVAVAPPGERKSAVFAALSAPIYEYEAQRRELETEEIQINQTEKNILEKSLANAEATATKGKNQEARTQAREEALALSSELANFKDKHPFRLCVDDTTPEKLVDIMDAQNGCITVASAEGGVFDALSGRYDKGTNFDIYLKGHAGDQITVDRINRKPNHINRPRLTMILTIQPEVLSGLMDNATFRGRGLCGRFLYAMCKSKVGCRKIEPDPVPQWIKEEYNQFLRRVLSSQDSGIIRLSDEAHKVRVEYATCIEQRLGDEWEHMRDWGGKLVGAMLRIAALIHASEVQGDPTKILISPETVTAAVRIAEFLGSHAMAAYQAMGADKSYEDAKYLLRRIDGTGQEEISKRDLWQLCKGRFKKVDEMEPALQALVGMGYIREEEVSTGGRPTRKLIVNPKTKGIKWAS